MSDPAFTPEDLSQAANYDVLGPAYFAARRCAESIMAGALPEPLKKAAEKAAEEVREKLYDYVEGFLLSDLESNLQSHIRRMVEGTVEALLTGQEWAMRQYPFADYNKGESIRAAVAKHGGDELQQKRAADLEKEIERLREQLRWARER